MDLVRDPIGGGVLLGIEADLVANLGYSRSHLGGLPSYWDSSKWLALVGFAYGRVCLYIWLVYMRLGMHCLEGT